jgi:hypothetical protein
MGTAVAWRYCSAHRRLLAFSDVYAEIGRSYDAIVTLREESQRYGVCCLRSSEEKQELHKNRVQGLHEARRHSAWH